MGCMPSKAAAPPLDAIEPVPVDSQPEKAILPTFEDSSVEEAKIATPTIEETPELEAAPVNRALFLSDNSSPSEKEAVEVTQPPPVLEDDTSLQPSAVWVADDKILDCTACKTSFTLFNRRHHCRSCGNIFCNECSSKRLVLSAPLTVGGTPGANTPGSPSTPRKTSATPSAGVSPSSTSVTGLQRVCESCFVKLNRRISLRRGASAAALLALAENGASSPSPLPMRNSDPVSPVSPLSGGGSPSRRSGAFASATSA